MAFSLNTLHTFRRTGVVSAKFCLFSAYICVYLECKYLHFILICFIYFVCVGCISSLLVLLNFLISFVFLFSLILFYFLFFCTLDIDFCYLTFLAAAVALIQYDFSVFLQLNKNMRGL